MSVIHDDDPRIRKLLVNVEQQETREQEASDAVERKAALATLAAVDEKKRRLLPPLEAHASRTWAALERATAEQYAAGVTYENTKNNLASKEQQAWAVINRTLPPVLKTALAALDAEIEAEQARIVAPLPGLREGHEVFVRQLQDKRDEIRATVMLPDAEIPAAIAAIRASIRPLVAATPPRELTFTEKLWQGVKNAGPASTRF